MTVPEIVGNIILDFFATVSIALPQFLAGLVLLIIGAIVASVFKQILLGVFRFVNFRALLKRVKASEALDVPVWEDLIAELLRWSIFILFLVATVETWGLTTVGTLLNELLLYLPNVFVSVVLAFVGVIVANLVRDIVRHGARGFAHKTAESLGSLARYAVIVFTTLLVLHQLGVASDLIRILFTGIVAMMAVAGGIAFGLGGQDTAKKILEELYKDTKR